MVEESNMKILVSNLTKSYGEVCAVQVLQNINMEISSGESLVIYGESGAGKSTLLHILGTLEKPSSGQIFFNDEEIFTLGDDRLSEFRNRHLGFVFQFHHLLPDFSILENVAMPLMIRGEAKNKSLKKALYCLDQVGLEGKKDRRSNELSGGEQQRVAIARAIVAEPEVILADEPTGNLDEENSEKIFNLLLNMNRDLGTSLVVVTHNQKFISKFNRKVEIVDGRINS